MLRLLDGKTEYPFRTEPTGPWPALEGVVRPASARAIRTHDAKLRDLRAKGGPDAEAAVVAEQAAFYAAHLVRWSVDAPVTSETVAALPYDVFQQLDRIVAGQAGLVLGNSAATSA